MSEIFSFCLNVGYILWCPVCGSKKRVDNLHNNSFFQEDEWTIMPVSGIGQNVYQCYCMAKALILHDKSVDITW